MNASAGFHYALSDLTSNWIFIFLPSMHCLFMLLQDQDYILSTVPFLFEKANKSSYAHFVLTILRFRYVHTRQAN